MSSRRVLIYSTTFVFTSMLLYGCLYCSQKGAGFANDCNTYSHECYAAGTEDDSEAFCEQGCTVQPSSQFAGFDECTSCQIKTVYGTNCSPETPGSGFFDCETLSSVNPGGDVFTCTQKDCGAGYNKTRDCTQPAALPPQPV
jgi:hypothetical protein